jgi:hypothetical protein
MPLRNGNRTKKVRKSDNIELDSIIKFIKFIQGVSCGMLGISIIGMLLVKEDIGAKVVYTMVIIVNVIIIIGGMIPVKYLTEKNNNKYNIRKV